MRSAGWDALILGAGAAGLAAARRLKRAGRRVLVLEARDRAGGRAWTVPAPDGPVELGAEFVHGRPKALWDAIRELGLRAVEVPDVHLRRGPRGLAAPERYWEKVDAVMARLRERPPGRDRTFDEATRLARLRPFLRRDVRAAREYVESFHAADAARASETALARLRDAAEKAEEERAFRLVGGYASLLQPWARELGNALVLGAPATAVRWDARGVEVAAGGRRWRARRALVTLPAAVLRSGAPAFAPALEGKRAALDRLETGAVVKAVFRLARGPWERLGAGRAAFLHDPGEAPGVWWTAAPEQAARLTAWSGGPRAGALAARGRAAVRRACLGGLERLFPGRGLPRAVRAWHYHDWGADPWARGAYSWAAVGGADAARALGRPLGPLRFAGEATDDEGQSATVAGAIASGLRAADELLER